MFKFIAPLLACLAGVAASPAPSSNEARGALAGPPEFKITDFKVNGSGCPPGTAKYLVNTDRTAVTVTFSEFLASVGPGISISENRKNCQMTFGVHVPQGFTFGISNVDGRGFYELDKKVTANQRTITYFQGSLNQATCNAPAVVGPQTGYYTNRCTVGIASLVFCRCGADTVMNINTDVRVENSKNKHGSGLITRDSNDVSLITIFNFHWKRC